MVDTSMQFGSLSCSKTQASAGSPARSLTAERKGTVLSSGRHPAVIPSPGSFPFVLRNVSRDSDPWAFTPEFSQTQNVLTFVVLAWVIPF